ncbi:MAG: hypothetical protein CSA97_02960 [Bacteroidetes bacterium]|nr:MAG: hypothetical protein CSA97_02960 [Bacteroidota bacterium]
MVVVLVLLAIFVLGFLLVRTQPAVRQWFKDLSTLFPWLHYEPKSSYTDGQKRQLALSAPLASAASAYFESLVTGQELKRLEDYGIEDVQKARGTIEYRLSARESSHIVQIYQAFTLRSSPKYREFLEGVTGGDEAYYRELVRMHDNLVKTHGNLRKLGVIEQDSDILSIGLVAWDAALACWFARCSYELGYISEEDAWSYIARADGMARKVFTSWEGFGRSFLLGQAIVTGSMSVGTKAIVYELLRSKRSPWLKYEW